jgi:hypothetical protein
LALEEGEDGSEMERLDKSSIAFFTGLSLISSPDKNTRIKKRGLKIPNFCFEVEIEGGRLEGDGAKRKERELTESIWSSLGRLALYPDDDRLLLCRGL